MSNNLTLSVIIPALNEENSIKEAVQSTLSAFKKYNISGEIIVVNDGSTDNTRNIVENMQKTSSEIRMINHDRPMGIGFSFFDGIRISEKETVVMFPGDNEIIPEDALGFFFLMERVDIIIPFFHNHEVRTIKRRLLSFLFRTIINYTFGLNVNYTNGTVFYRRCILEGVQLKSSNFFYQAELLVKLLRKGYLFAEVPNFLSVRMGGESKATTLRSFFGVIKSYLTLFNEVYILRKVRIKDYKNLNPQSITYKKIYSNRN